MGIPFQVAFSCVCHHILGHLCPHMVSHPGPVHVVLFTALSSRDGHAPFMVADCQGTGSGSARLVKSYPWDWHNTLPLLPIGQGHYRVCPSSREQRKRPHPLMGDQQGHFAKRACEKGNVTAALFRKQHIYAVVNACFFYFKRNVQNGLDRIMAVGQVCPRCFYLKGGSVPSIVILRGNILTLGISLTPEAQEHIILKAGWFLFSSAWGWCTKSVRG